MSYVLWYFRLTCGFIQSETETESKRWDSCLRERLPNVSSWPAARGRSEGPAQQINIALSRLTPCPTGARCCRHTQMVQTRNIFLAAALTQPRFPYCNLLTCRRSRRQLDFLFAFSFAPPVFSTVRNVTRAGIAAFSCLHCTFWFKGALTALPKNCGQTLTDMLMAAFPALTQRWARFSSFGKCSFERVTDSTSL